MSKICLINQPAGLGDILFLQKFIDKKLSDGFEVIFPVNSNLIFLNEYIIKPNLKFVSIDSDFPHKSSFYGSQIIKTDDFEFYPFSVADRYIKGSCMEAKYTFVNEDYNNWQNHLVWERNIEKENYIFYEYCKLNDGEKYTVVSNTWGTLPHSSKREIQTNQTYPVINIQSIDGYTIFDWAKVLENATEIYMIDTSFNYIIEKLDMSAENLYLFSRFTPPNFSHIINLFKKNWIYQK